jgi:hypothetical protein
MFRSQFFRLAALTGLTVFVLTIPTNAWAFCELTYTDSGSTEDGVWADQYVMFDLYKSIGVESPLTCNDLVYQYSASFEYDLTTSVNTPTGYVTAWYSGSWQAGNYIEMDLPSYGYGNYHVTGSIQERYCMMWYGGYDCGSTVIPAEDRWEYKGTPTVTLQTSNQYPPYNSGPLNVYTSIAGSAAYLYDVQWSGCEPISFADCFVDTTVPGPVTVTWWGLFVNAWVPASLTIVVQDPPPPPQPPVFRVTLNAFIPYDNIIDPFATTIMAWPGAIYAIGNSLGYAHPNRDPRDLEDRPVKVSELMHLYNWAYAPAAPVFASNTGWAGFTELFDGATSLSPFPGGVLTQEALDDYNVFDFEKRVFYQQGQLFEEGCTGAHFSPVPGVDSVSLNCHRRAPPAGYEFLPFAFIEYDIHMILNMLSPTRIEYGISGCRKWFPKYQFWIAGNLVYSGNDTGNLFDLLLPCDEGVGIEKIGEVDIQ